MKQSTKTFYLMCYLSKALLSSSFALENEQPKSPGQVEYEMSCMSCHGLDGQGDGPQAESLSIMPPDLTLLAKARRGEFPEREIYDLIDGRGVIPAHGKREMPVWGLRYRTERNSGKDPIQKDEGARQKIENHVTYLKQIQRK